jgi:DNA-binding SARP family transcriptional activator
MAPSPGSETEDLILQALQTEQDGDMAGALRLARRALEAARAGGLPLDCARALTAVARYRFRLGQYETARQLAQEAKAMTDPHQEQEAVVHTEALLMLGMCALETNSLAECEQYYRSAADLAREIGHALLFQRALHNLGSAVYLFHGQFDLAIANDAQALQICREKGFSDWAMFPLITLAIAYQITGQSGPTRQTLAELRAIARPGSGGDGYACYVSGMLALDEDDFKTAEAELTRALTLAESLGDPSLNLDTRLGLSRLSRLGGDAARALAWAEDALGFARRVGYRIYQGRACLEIGRAAWLTEDLVSAGDHLNQAEAIFIEMDMRCDLAEVRLVLAGFLRQQKDLRSENLYLQAAAAIQSGGYEFLLVRERALVFPLVALGLNDSNPVSARTSASLLERLQRVPPHPLKVVTLGGLAVWVGARPVESKVLRQRRAGELLALLFSSPGYSLSSAQVTEAMCPEKEPQAALDFFHHGISALRRLLEPDLSDRRFPCRYLEASDERIALLAPPGSTLDYEVFEDYLHQKEWEKAITLYKGEYLPEFRYAEWTIAHRQHLSDRFEQALLILAEERLRQGRLTACLDLARQLLLRNPWQEQMVALGMQAALESGDRSTAIHLYQRLVKVLDKELGIAPQKELQQLYNSIHKPPSKK